MKLLMFSIFDVVAKIYSQPFFMPTTGQALRAFGDEVNNPQSTINKHPADFRLFKLGDFDDNSGVIVSKNAEFLANAVDFVPPKLEGKNG